MNVPNSNEFMTILRHTVDGLAPESEAVQSFNRSNLVIRIFFDDIPNQITFDGRMGEVFWTDTSGRADLEMNLTSRLFHEVMVGDRSLREIYY